MTALGVVLLGSCGVAAAQSTVERAFTETVQPFVRQHCTVCHGGSNPAAQFDLASYGTFEAVVNLSRGPEAGGRPPPLCGIRLR